jgi:hypothetical protein
VVAAVVDTEVVVAPADMVVVKHFDKEAEVVVAIKQVIYFFIPSQSQLILLLLIFFFWPTTLTCNVSHGHYFLPSLPIHTTSSFGCLLIPMMILHCCFFFVFEPLTSNG